MLPTRTMTVFRPQWLLVACFLSGLLGAATFYGANALIHSGQRDESPWFREPSRSGGPVVAAGGVDFTGAAQVGSPSVVFIKTLSSNQMQPDAYWGFWDFFGNRRGPIASAGSGVIFSTDGYIVTNNHVVNNAEQITVVLSNKHAYAAKVVGTDPNTDLALLKIEATGLPAVKIANSDNVKIGEWVLAVGNPLNLNSTVTAGIVSAKGRNINILNTQFPIESFIQTDAAINPGNSGGALLNLKGELIGINTAIKSQTGAYSGYGFAIPVNIVNKVVKDLIDHGSVQQAFLGAEVVDIDETIAKNLGTDDYSGVFVQGVADGSGASEAGLQPGDIILKVDDFAVQSTPEYHERMAFHRPGEKVKILFRRNGSSRETNATLTNKEGTTDVVTNTSTFVESLGCEVSPLSMIEKQRYHVQSGWRLSGIRQGRVARLGLQEGSVVLKVNNVAPQTIDELAGLIVNSRGRIIMDCLDANGNPLRFQYFSY